MEVKLQHSSFLNSSSSNQCLSRNSIVSGISFKRVAHLDYVLINWGNSRKRYPMKLTVWRNGNQSLNYHSFGYKKLNLTHIKTGRMGHLFPLASGDDGVTVNGIPSASANSDVEEMRVKLNQSLQGEDSGDKLVQSLHDAARVFEVAIKEQGLLSKFSWLSTAWLGMDRNAWVKTLCYQVIIIVPLTLNHSWFLKHDVIITTSIAATSTNRIVTVHNVDAGIVSFADTFTIMLP
ncbi:hypothetical protein OIU78_002311 [Salix suchowensis]|nr:hypothetical protein OIU78_002311 [Salix suchowensis]